MPGSSIDILWLLFIGTSVLLLLTWLIVASTILYKQRQRITESEKLKAISESEERYRRFVEEDLTGDFTASIDGRINSCNPAFMQIFGIDSPETALHTNLSELYPDSRELRTLIAELRTVKKLEYYETQLLRLDMKPVYVIQNIIGEFDSEGRLTSLRGYIFDNTERKFLEAQLLQAQKMQGIGTLAGGIAHDFNNILGVILGQVSMLGEKLEHDDEARMRVVSVQQAVKRGAGLVRQILTFASKAETDFKPVDLNAVVAEAFSMLQSTFPKTIELKNECNSKPLVITGDYNHCHQALLNLCLNARDAMAGGGVLTVSSRMLPIADIEKQFPKATAEKYVLLQVGDTGSGITPEVRERLFEPFFTTKPRGRGTGLGLSVVYGIIHSHHAFIDVDSTPGRGTTFNLYFPAARDEELQEAAIKREKDPRGTERLLIVEDVDTIADVLQSVLVRNGYTVEVARDGEEAIEIYEKNFAAIDLVIIDIDLPKKDGWETFHQMQTINPNVCAVFASGYIEPETRAKFAERNIADFIQKPYLPSKLMLQLREILDRVDA